MKSFKQFLEAKKPQQKQTVSITETTIPAHLQHIPDNWDHHAYVDEHTQDKISKVFGGSDFTHFPLDNTSHEPDADVVDHLDRHGWSISDYQKGMASKKTMVGDESRGIPMREKVVSKKIGAILDDTNAPPDTKTAFVNDPARSKTFKPTSGGLHVVVSTNPHAIGGMSVGTNWTSSCMNLDGGSNRRYLKNDSENGTHVAFLVHHDDPTAFKTGLPSNPIARIAIKAHHLDEDDQDPDGENDGKDTIFRPEGRQYGSGGTKFDHAVSQWAITNYPAKSGTYHKNDELYDDDGKTSYTAIDPMKSVERIKQGLGAVKSRGDSIDSTALDDIVHAATNRISSDIPDSEKHATIGHITAIGNLGKHHVNRIFRTAKEAGGMGMALGVLQDHGDKLSTTNVSDSIDYMTKKLGSAEATAKALPPKVLMNTKLPEHVVDALHPDQYEKVHNSLIKPKHITKVAENYANNESGSFYPFRHFVNRMSGDDLHKIINRESQNHFGVFGKDSWYAMSRAPAFSREHHEKMLNSGTRIDHGILASSDDNKASNAMNRFLKESPHTTFDDVDHFGAHVAFASRPDVSEADGKKLKDKFMSDLEHDKNLDPQKKRRSQYTVDGKVNTWKSIPTSISKHFTTDDYHKLAQAGKTVPFENAAHSHRYSDHLEDHAKKLDDALDEHINDHENDVDDYDVDEDDHAIKLHNQLHKTMGMLAQHLDNHLDKHVDDDGHVGNHNELQKVEEHLEFPHTLKRYQTPKNAYSWRVDTSHHGEHFGDVEDRIHEMKERTEERDNQEDW